ncbi:hypothetical protein ACS0TY_014041 [Phlomoides rotata]
MSPTVPLFVTPPLPLLTDEAPPHRHYSPIIARLHRFVEVKKEKEKENMRSSRRQLKAMLRKNWLLKIHHPC